MDFVRAKRSVVDPNEGFVNQLIEFEDNKMRFANEEVKKEQPKENLSRNTAF